MKRKQIRYLNVRLLIAERHDGVAAKFVAKMKFAQSYVSAIAPKVYEDGIKGIGDEQADVIAEAYGRPAGWLDQPHYGEWKEFGLWAGKIPPVEAIEPRGARAMLLHAVADMSDAEITDLILKIGAQKAAQAIATPAAISTPALPEVGKAPPLSQTKTKQAIFEKSDEVIGAKDKVIGVIRKPSRKPEDESGQAQKTE